MQSIYQDKPPKYGEHYQLSDLEDYGSDGSDTYSELKERAMLKSTKGKDFDEDSNLFIQDQKEESAVSDYQPSALRPMKKKPL